MNEPGRREEVFDGPLARAVSAIVANPTHFERAPEIPSVVLDAWRDGPVHGLVGRAQFETHCLRLEVEGPEERLREVFLARSRAADGELTGTADGRLKLTATWVNRYGSFTSADRPAPTKLGFQLFEWSLVPSTPPRIWVGRLHGLNGAPAHTNLTVVTGWGCNALQLLLPQDVDSDYALICVDPETDHYLLAVDTKGDGQPNRESLNADLGVLEFLHGARLRVDLLVGLNDDNEPVGCTGSRYGRYEGDPLYAEYPIPLVPGHRCWALPAFRRLAPRARQGPRVVRLAMEYYLASFTGYPDAAYLNLTVALEGVAMAVLRDRGSAKRVVQEQSGELWRVQDPKGWQRFLKDLRKSPEYAAWKQLVESRRDAIYEHALPHLDMRHHDGLFESVVRLSSEMTGHLPATRRVEAAFATVGIEFDKAMQEEAKRWNTARHEAVPEAASPNVGLNPQLRVLRAMLAELLLGWVGYQGPVLGHGRHDPQRPTHELAKWLVDPSHAVADGSDVRFLIAASGETPPT